MYQRQWFTTQQIGANPEKSDLVNYRGLDWKKVSELRVLPFFPRKKSTKSYQNPGFVKQFWDTAWGQLHWASPIANSCESCATMPDFDQWTTCWRREDFQSLPSWCPIRSDAPCACTKIRHVPLRNYYINNLLRIISCIGTSLLRFYVMTPKTISPGFFCVVANPTN